MTDEWDNYARFSTGDIATPSDLPLRIPKNKSTGNLLAALTTSVQTSDGRSRFSFDAGSAQELSNLKRTTRIEHDNVLGVSGLRRIRRPGPPSRTPTLIFDDTEFIPPTLKSSQTLPVSGNTSRSISRSASTNFFAPVPASPAVEDLHRFPSESLHSFSFARQTEDFLHSRQNILKKSIEFMQDRPAWAANTGLANAQARVSGDVEIQGMMDLIRRANVVPSLDIEAARTAGIGLGPITGPADFEGRNVFEKSFSRPWGSASSSRRSSIEYRQEGRRGSIEPDLKKIDEDNEQQRPPAPDPAPAPAPRKFGLKRTYTDVNSMSLQQKLLEALAQPYTSDEQPELSDKNTHPFPSNGTALVGAPSSAVHSHSSKWTTPAQAVFRTTADAPWTILAANDLACLTFGVTRAEVRSLSILGIIQEDRRQWLESKLERPAPVLEKPKSSTATSVMANGPTSMLGSRGGITARLLSKGPSRSKPVPKTQTDDGIGGPNLPPPIKNHPPTRSRGVILCGDIVPIQKRDGTPGAASFWLMEKKGGLIWVVEEVTEDVAYLTFDGKRKLVSSRGDVEPIWGDNPRTGLTLKQLIPKFPYEALNDPEHDTLPLIDYFTAQTLGGVNVPIAVAKGKQTGELRVSSLPHIAGVMVLDPQTLKISNSNSVFSAALFGYDIPNGLSLGHLIPHFGDFLSILSEEDDFEFVDGLVVPEHSFRKARALLALREGKEDAANLFLRPSGLPARHKDGSDIMVDVQMRVVRSESVFPLTEDVIVEEKDQENLETQMSVSELVYAVWITYSRQLHSAGLGVERPDHPQVTRPSTPPTQPQPTVFSSPPATVPDTSTKTGGLQTSLEPQPVPNENGISPVEPIEHPPAHTPYVPHEKKTIEDFMILEEMGKGAYGEVKLARYKKSRSSKVVLKYVIKRRILVDTWTRDRRLGTVPLEIHVLDYLRTPGMQHPNIVEMIDFFEDSTNYYIEMLPHGIPGMDLFDYIELRANMEEIECRNIFRQVVDAVHHLHVKARVVHRDIKDENVVLDGEGQVKLIDFGSAAYIKNGPFDVFVGTLEVLQGRPYGGPEQDVWALGILLYTIVYKENPFYNIDEILDHPLRVPYVPFSELCIDLIRSMLDRDVEGRITIEQVKTHEWMIQE